MDYGLLIETIQNYPYIYEMTHKLYKDSKEKSQAWQQISEIVNCNVDECMKAWKNLRDRFVKEKNKLASGAEALECKWPYFDAMLFYQKCTKPRSKYTTTKKSTDSRSSSESPVWNQIIRESPTSPDTSRSGSSMVLLDDEAVAGPNFPAMPSDSRQAPSWAFEVTSAPTIKKKRKRSVSTVDPGLEKVLNIDNSIASNMDVRPIVSRNVNSTFVEYLYYELEKLSEEKAKEKRKQMLMLLFDA